MQIYLRLGNAKQSTNLLVNVSSLRKRRRLRILRLSSYIYLLVGTRIFTYLNTEFLHFSSSLLITSLLEEAILFPDEFE